LKYLPRHFTPQSDAKRGPRRSRPAGQNFDRPTAVPSECPALDGRFIAIAGIALGVALVVAGADALVDGLLGAGERLRISPFVLVVLLSGFELENLAAGIAANAEDLPGAAAGTVSEGLPSSPWGSSDSAG
jgi:hypothetical protein